MGAGYEIGLSESKAENTQFGDVNIEHGFKLTWYGWIAIASVAALALVWLIKKH